MGFSHMKPNRTAPLAEEERFVHLKQIQVDEPKRGRAHGRSCMAAQVCDHGPLALILVSVAVAVEFWC